MVIIIRLQVLLVSLIISGEPIAGDVALGFNTYTNRTDKPLELSTNSFMGIISRGVFVDKTELIKDILSTARGIAVITGPQGWGKTTNLDMLKLFLKIQVHPNGTRMRPVSDTPNYRLFKTGEYRTEYFDIKLEKPPLISADEEMMEKILGKHPIIHLTFAEKIYYHKRCYEMILDEAVAEAFQEHLYMLDVYDALLAQGSDPEVEMRKQTFTNFMKCDEDDDYTVEHGVQFLSEELNTHFKKKPIILIDEYDRFLNTKHVAPIFKDFLYFSVECNEFARKTILAGRLPIEFGSENVHYYDFQGATPFQHYYGFTGEEMNLISRFYRMPSDQMEEIQYWYGGYRARRNLRQILFNPRSVRKYVNSRQFKSYHLEVQYEDTHLNNITQLSTLQYALSRFLNGKEYEYTISKKFPFKRGDVFSLNQTAFNAIEYLFTAGYVTMKRNITSQLVVLQIPNYEMSNRLQKNFVASLRKLFDKPLCVLLSETSSKWERFLLTSNKSSSTKLDDYVQKCIHSLYKELHKVHMLYYDDTSSTEALVHIVTLSLITSKQLDLIGWHFYHEDRIGLSKETYTPPDLVVSSAARGIVINVYNEENADTAVNRTREYTKAWEKYAKLRHWKDIKFVDCKIVLVPYKHIEITSIIHPIDSGVQNLTGTP